MLGDKFSYPLSHYSGPHLDFKITTTIKLKKKIGKVGKPIGLQIGKVHNLKLRIPQMAS